MLAPNSARWLWQRLRAAFPNAHACSLMPDHIHLQVPGTCHVETFRRILAQHGLVFGTRWTTHTQESSTTKIAWRSLAYVACNPLRSRCVEDPWTWPWTTLRDLAGVIVDPWTVEPVRRISQSVGVPRGLVLQRLTQFEGRHAPLPARQPDAPVVASSQSLAAAVASSLRCLPEDIRERGAARSLYVHLASTCASLPTSRIAESCRISPRAAYKILAQPQPSGLTAALRCLQDPRLLIHDVDPDPLSSAYREATTLL